MSCTDDISSITLEDAKILVTRYMLEVQKPNEQCRAHLCNGLRIVPQIWGTISVELIFYGRPRVL